jgi:lipoprotein signal peptidase
MVIGLSLDLATKYMAVDRLFIDKYETPTGSIVIDTHEYKMFPGLLHFQYHENRGAVFGIGQGARVLFLIVSAMALGLLGYLFVRSGQQRLYQILLGMLLAGVLGNLYDRAVYGYVRDMIHAFPAAGIFPWIFNIADSMLCVGVGGMFVFTMLRRDHPMTAKLDATMPDAGESR